MIDMNEHMNKATDVEDSDQASDSGWALWKSRLRAVAREGLTLAAVIVFTFAARSTFADHYTVPSGSMEETLQVGDRVVVDKTAYGIRIPFTSIEILQRAEPARGEIVILDSPTSGVRLIKRVAAVSGDHVALHDGILIINGEPLADPSVPAVEDFGEHRALLDLSDGGGQEIADLWIPPGMVLLLGDHRGNSVDGRFFGLVPTDAIYARAIAVYWRSGEGLVWRGL
jgi:signal peptidase I